MGFSGQENWSGFPFLSWVDHILSELSTVTHPTWVALHGMTHSFIDLDKAVIHVISLISFLWLWFSFCLPSEGWGIRVVLTLSDRMNYAVHWILQARILEGVAFPFFRGSSQSRDWSQVSLIACGLFFTSWATKEAHIYIRRRDKINDYSSVVIILNPTWNLIWSNRNMHTVWIT